MERFFLSRQQSVIKLNQKGRIELLLILVGLCVVINGCMDGPFYSMKHANPWIQQEWAADRELGPTFAERIEELEVLDLQIESMSPEDQERWARQLEVLVEKDPSPEFRSRCLPTLARIQSPTAVRALNRASSDESEKVRLAACKAWGIRRDNAGRDMLLSISTTDQSNSVRMAAIESLVQYDEPEVRSVLTNLLDDRSPAIQYQVATSLAKKTGKNFGGDFESWKKLLNGKNVTEPQSMTAKAIESLNVLR